MNGNNFHTRENGSGKRSVNSGICVEGVLNDFYGVIEEIIEARGKIEEQWKETAYQQVKVTRPIDPNMHDILMLRDQSDEMVLVDDIEIYLPQLGQFEIGDVEEEELDNDDKDDIEEEEEEDEADDFDFD
ncbi:hypothetical protein ACH5RR_000496 [Cinchona calisaya]|uniref:Uncharacterized protein n=1 Tax=Cinchona calisaya TaxID=153742 RepID=A0ABD3B0S7_9GENT